MAERTLNVSARLLIGYMLGCLIAAPMMSIVQAQINDEYQENEELTQTNDPVFPFCACKRTPQFPSPYSIVPVTQSSGNGRFCFTIQILLPCLAPPSAPPLPPGVRNGNIPPAHYCCNMDLKKIEFEIASRCRPIRSIIRATVNGALPPAAPNFANYELTDGSRRLVFKLTNLNLTLATANNTRICIDLSAAGPACDTLEELCVPPVDNAPLGTCNIALFNNNNSTADACCPTSITTPPPRPPSPRPLSPRPPSPRPPSAPPSCRECVNITLTSNEPFPLLTISPGACQYLQQFMATTLSAVIADLDLAMTQIFAPNASLCLTTSVAVCGTFATTPAAISILRDAFDVAMDSILTEALKPYCLTNNNAVTVSVEPVQGNCINVTGEKSCPPNPPPNPFPNCTCNTRPLSHPYYVDLVVTKEPGRTAATTLYCFTIKEVPPEFVSSAGVNCGIPTVSKVEVWADDRRRRNITGIRVTPNNGNTYWTSPNWGAPGFNALKVSPLDWDYARAVGGQFCLELNSALDAFCLGVPNGCFASVFSGNRRCCPNNAATLPYFPLP